MTVLSTIQQLIERTLYTTIRGISVEHGYSVDLTAYPNTQVGQQNYNTAMNGIFASRGFAVEVFGVSNPQAKGEKRVARVVLQTEAFLPGDVGNEFVQSFEVVSGGSDIKGHIWQGTRNNLHIRITLSSNTAEQARILNAILFAALSNRGWLTVAGSVQGKFFYEMLAFDYDDQPDEGYMNYEVIYKITDVQITEPTLSEDTYVNISEITYDFFKNYIDDLDTYEPTKSDDLTIL